MIGILAYFILIVLFLPRNSTNIKGCDSACHPPHEEVLE
jgi:hypothetical protein